MNPPVTAIDQDKQGTLWIAIFGLGIICVDGSEVKEFPSDPKWVPLPEVRSLCLDRDDNLWVGTHHGLGLRKSDGSTKVFTKKDVLLDDTVWTLTTDRLGKVWVITDKGPVVYDGHRWRYPHLVDDRPLLSGGPYGTILETSDGSQWIGDWKGAVRNPRTMWSDMKPGQRALAEAKRRVEQSDPKLASEPWAAKDRLGRMWILIDDCIWRFDGRRWEEIREPSVDGAHITFLRADKKNRILIGTNTHGLFVYDGDQLSRFNNQPNNSMSYIYDMAEDNDGTIYFGTQHGLYSLSGSDWKMLTDEYQVHPVAVDGKGRVWFGDVNRGLVMYSEGKVKEFSASGTLQGYRVRDLTATSSGTMRVTAYRRSSLGEPIIQVFDCDGDSVVPVNEPAN